MTIGFCNQCKKFFDVLTEEPASYLCPNCTKAFKQSLEPIFKQLDKYFPRARGVKGQQEKTK